MPADDGLRLHHDEDAGPAGPKPSQRDPEEPVQPAQAGRRPLPLEDGALLPQSQDLQGGVLATPEEDANGSQESKHELEHKPYVVACPDTPGGASVGGCKSLITRGYGVLITHSGLRAAAGPEKTIVVVGAGRRRSPRRYCRRGRHEFSQVHRPGIQRVMTVDRVPLALPVTVVHAAGGYAVSGANP